MKVITLILSLSFVFNCISVQASFDCERACEMLVDNLAKFHGKVEPSQVSRYADDWLIFNRSAEFMDAADLLSFSVTCEKGKALVRQEIRRRLRKFNEHYVFEEDWFNALVYWVLSEYFPCDNLSSPETKDYAALMVCKYALKERLKLNVPNHIYFGIISFIFEAVFGKGINVPIEDEGQLVHFLGQQVQKFDLPKTLEYLSDALNASMTTCVERSNLFTLPSFNRCTLNLLNFLSTKPDAAEFGAFIQTPLGYSYKNVQAFLFEEGLAAPFHNPTHMNFRIIEAIGIKPVSTAIFNRIPNLNNSHLTRSGSDWFRPFLLKNYNLPSGDPLKDYLSSIDFDNLFSIERFKELSGNDTDLMAFVLYANIPFLLKMDIFYKCKPHFDFMKNIDRIRPEVLEILQ